MFRTFKESVQRVKAFECPKARSYFIVVSKTVLAVQVGEHSIFALFGQSNAGPSFSPAEVK